MKTGISTEQGPRPPGPGRWFFSGLRIFAVLLVAAGVVGDARAQFMLSPVGVQENGLGSFSPEFAALTNLINQSGLNLPFVSGVTEFDSYFAPPNDHFSRNADRTKWQSDLAFTLPLTGTLDFDLGGTYLVSKVAIWNVSVRALTVKVSGGADGPWKPAGVFLLGDQQSSLSLRATVLDLGPGSPARMLRLDIAEEFPALPNVTYGYATVGEVVVRAAPIPVISPILAIAHEFSGDITVRFTGTLQSADAPAGPFSDVPNRPREVYSLPAGSLVSERYFRAVQ